MVRTGALFFLISFAFVCVFCQIPQIVYFQGRVLDVDGNPIDDGTHSFTFRLYDVSSGGSPMWTETQEIYTVNGLFSAALGSITTFGDDVSFDIPLWLSVEVDGAGEMEPRYQLAVSPYAFRAIRADTAEISANASHSNYADSSEFSNTSIMSAEAIFAHSASYAETSGVAFTASYADEAETAHFVDYADSANIAGTAYFATFSETSHYAESTDVAIFSLSASWEGLTGIPDCFADGEDDFEDDDADTTNELISFIYWDDDENTLLISEGDHSNEVSIDVFKDYLGDNFLNDLGDVYVEGAEPGDVLGYDGSSWGPVRADVYDCCFWNVDSFSLSEPVLYPSLGATVENQLIIRKSGGVGISTFPSDTSRLRISAQSDKFGVLIDAEGTSGSQIGLHTATSTFASLVKNAYYDGSNWNRFNTSCGAYLHEIVPNGDLHIRIAGSGSNPISWSEAMYIKNNGYVGIGTTNPTERLEVNGTAKVKVLKIMGGSDIAEQFEITKPPAVDEIKPGMVVSIDDENPGKLTVSERSYDKRVAGIVSGAGGIESGMIMAQNNSIADGRYPVAISGRVYCLADASEEPIEPGDLLTTSNTPGYAMKVKDYERARGAIIGKAMTPLRGGKGLVLVLVTLQ